MKRHTNKQQSSRRQKTRIFYLAKQDLTAVRVFKQMFCNVQQVTNGSLGRALNRQGDTTFSEKRGKNAPGNKKSEEYIDTV